MGKNETVETVLETGYWMLVAGCLQKMKFGEQIVNISIIEQQVSS